MASEDVLLRVQLDGDGDSNRSDSQSNSPHNVVGQQAGDDNVAREIEELRDQITASLEPLQQVIAELRQASSQETRAADEQASKLDEVVKAIRDEGDKTRRETKHEQATAKADPIVDPDAVKQDDRPRRRDTGRSFDITKERPIFPRKPIEKPVVAEIVAPPKPPPIAATGAAGAGEVAGAAAAGSVAGPIGAAVAVAATFFGLRAAADRLRQSFTELVENTKELDGVVAQSIAQRDRELLQARRIIALDSREELKSLIRGQTDFQIERERFTAELVQIFEPFMREFLDIASGLLRIVTAMLDKIDNILDFIALLRDPQWIGDMLTALGVPKNFVDTIVQFIDLVSLWFRKQDEPRGSIEAEIDDFLNPDKFAATFNAGP